MGPFYNPVHANNQLNSRDKSSGGYDAGGNFTLPGHSWKRHLQDRDDIREAVERFEEHRKQFYTPEELAEEERLNRIARERRACEKYERLVNRMFGYY